MQLTSRRRVLAAVATAAVAAALAAVASGRGCEPLDASPEGAVRAFVSAARGRDRAAVWALLGPATRERMERLAERASATVGGAERFTPLDVLDVHTPESSYAPTGYRLVERDGDRAVVEVTGPAGQRDLVRVVRVGSRWRVELDFLE